MLNVTYFSKHILNTTDRQRELRMRRVQQRLKLKQKKEQRQIVKETKSGLFCNTVIMPLSSALPEEDTDIDILS